jgi:serine/threonine-protein kinase
MSVGKLLGAFEILGPLGAGGMGEVYRARDTRLKRDVAIKVLPRETADDAESIARLKREATLLASLNHPNIATIYGLDQEGGTHFLVLELIEGQSLAQRLLDERLSLEQALDVARQIADALEAAHERGVLHRDLKPSNVMLTRRDLVKVLDFGLAKSFAIAGVATDSTEITHQSNRLSGPHSIVGTLGYMSPEQLHGRPVDQRTDIWSFGCVLFEVLTGTKAFVGETLLDVLDRILKGDPAWDRLPASTPAAIESLVRRCLQKDVERRLHHIADARIEIEEALAPRKGVKSTEMREPSVAVLPFVNRSADPENEYFSDGLAEELIHELSRIKGLRIAARASSFQFKSESPDIHRIGARLGVDTVLDGSVRRIGNRVRVTVQLVNVADGYQLWSQRFDRDMQDVFAVQDEIAHAIVDNLQVAMADTHRKPLMKRYTENLDAYHLYMKGRFYWNKRHEGGLRQSMEYFTRAIEIDPGHALALTGLADAYWSLGIFMVRPPKEVFPLARSAALKALAIDDELAPAHTALALIKWVFDWDWTGAEEEFRRAIELDPTSSFAHGYYASLLSLLGRRDEATGEAQRSQDVDPFSSAACGMAGLNFALNAQYSRAIESCRQSLEIEPNYFGGGWVLAWIYDRLGRYDEALELLSTLCDRYGRRPMLSALLGHALGAMGRRDEARQILAELEEQSRTSYVSSVLFGWLNHGLGDMERANEWMEKAYGEQCSPISFFLYDRFEHFLRRMGLPGS